MLKFSKIADITGGTRLQLGRDSVINKLLIDSRKLSIHTGTVFFAIKGPRNNGHHYLKDLYAKGLRNFVIQEPADDWLSSAPEANVLLVENTVKALQQLAQFHREQFQLPVLGITGSNAKTVIKEWLSQLLCDKKVVKSPKSYNSQVGVPLSVWELNDAAELGIFEAGISKLGEMDNLQKIIQPTLGVFTNIGSAHDQGFASQIQKIKEKTQLFRASEKVVYCQDHELVKQHLTLELNPDQLVSWSTKEPADITFTKKFSRSSVGFRWEYEGNTGEIWCPFKDAASQENLLHCVALLLVLQYPADFIQDGCRNLQQIDHRLALKKGLNNCYIVDDTYNNDLAGLEIALDFLNQQPHGKYKALILSDILQASDPDAVLYEKVAQLVSSEDIETFYGIGPGITAFKHLFASENFYSTTAEFLQADISFRDQLVLVKGARSFGFEAIVNRLQEKLHGTVLEINLDALTNNLNHHRKIIPTGTKIMVMVKAFAYGSGSQEVAHLLQYQGVDYLGVAYTDEGIDLRRDGIHLPIMVMNPAPESFEKLFEFDLEPEIYSLALLHKFQEFSATQNKPLPIHLKIDTGMKRLGFETSQLELLIESLIKQPLPIASIFSHLAAADDVNEASFSHQQYQQFQESVQIIEKGLNISPLKHLLNSSGIVSFPEFRFDMVRLGIGLYGVGAVDSNLQNISTLKTTISQIKSVAPNETVGYGRKGVATTSRTIATIAIGYGDGFDRRNGNGIGKVLIGSQIAPVIGHVCMDMSMVDVTGIEVEVGDTVIIFNEQRTIQQIAQDIGTIPYEILTQVSERVKRIYFAQ